MTEYKIIIKIKIKLFIGTARSKITIKYKQYTMVFMFVLFNWYTAIIRDTIFIQMVQSYTQ